MRIPWSKGSLNITFLDIIFHDIFLVCLFNILFGFFNNLSFRCIFGSEKASYVVLYFFYLFSTFHLWHVTGY